MLVSVSQHTTRNPTTRRCITTTVIRLKDTATDTVTGGKDASTTAATTADTTATTTTLAGTDPSIDELIPKAKRNKKKEHHFIKDHPNPENPPEYYVPRAERGERSVFSIDAVLGEARLNRNNRLCPTRELNFTPDHWRKHKSPYRRIRHMANMVRSSPVQRLLFPDIFGVAIIGAGLTYYNEFIACSETIASMSSTGFTGATTAIGLLAGFRLNASYGRYEECRIFWGDINNTIRDLAMETMMWMKDVKQQKRMLKLCRAFPMTLMYHLNGKGCHHNMTREGSGIAQQDDNIIHHEFIPLMEEDNNEDRPFDDRIHAEFQAELRDIYSDSLHEADFVRLSTVKYTGGNTPLEVLNCMRETIAGSIGTVDSIYVRELDEQCQRLCAAFGASERVLRTPLPTGFTRHSSRLMFLWSHFMPFALYPVMGPLGTLPTAVLTTYAVLGIEDIGVQLEEPFDILPLRQYSDGMFDAIGAIEKGYTPYVIGNDERDA